MGGDWETLIPNKSLECFSIFITKKAFLGNIQSQERISSLKRKFIMALSTLVYIFMTYIDINFALEPKEKNKILLTNFSFFRKTYGEPEDGKENYFYFYFSPFAKSKVNF